MNNVYFSNYEERINRTPKDPGRWSGKRGESECLPSTQETKAILHKYGRDSVTYSCGIPDFSPYSESTVKIDNISGARKSYNIKLVSSNNAFEKASAYHYNHHMGNYEKADIVTAREWNKSSKDGHHWNENDVRRYREQNKLTWHECNDQKTMMLIPTEINSEFGHLGGTSEAKSKEDINNILTQVTVHSTENRVDNNKSSPKQGRNEMSNSHSNAFNKAISTSEKPKNSIEKNTIKEKNRIT